MSGHLQEQARQVFSRWVGNTDRVDHLAWAKRLVWRHENGDKSVTLIQLKMAQDALGEQ